ncbi:hypothetical protein [Nitrosomonas sp.]|jgi:hypothetical protein|uniref:hypothetical protein n=1 Tax=Nitrosomonas sp. TaxID=42353 RepID=UPI00272FF9C6|nr:hypothetical protein [Nitrosomonas sp.]MDP1785843.1 hypothetical protein [Nitrosomonas sp.]MDP2223243.1 hypothetical protein [Nitrosomonas sp.]
MSRPFRLEFPNALYHVTEIWSNLKGQIYLGDAAFVTEMQKRIGREKDDLNIPQQQKWPIAKPLSEIAAQHKDRVQRSLPPTKPAHTASEKSGSSINCTQRRLGLLFAFWIWHRFAYHSVDQH